MSDVTFNPQVNSKRAVKPEAQAKVENLETQKAQEQTAVNAFEGEKTDNQSALDTTIGNIDVYQAEVENYQNQYDCARDAYTAATSDLSQANVQVSQLSAQASQIDQQIQQLQSNIFKKAVNFVKGLFTETEVERLQEQKETVEAKKTEAEQQKQEAQNEVSQQAGAMREAASSKMTAQQKLEKEKALSESIKNKIEELEASIADGELKIEDYEEAIRQALEEVECDATDEAVTATAAAYMAGKEGAKNNTVEEGGNVQQNEGTEGTVPGTVPTINNGTENGAESGEETPDFDENGNPIIKDTKEDDKINDAVLNDGAEEEFDIKSITDGMASTLVDSSITGELNTDKLEESLVNDPAIQMDPEKAKEQVEIAQAVAVYEAAGIDIDSETIKNALISNNIAELDTAVEAAMVQGTFKSATGVRLIGRAANITTKKELEELGKAESDLAENVAELEKTYKVNDLQDVAIDAFLAVTNELLTQQQTGSFKSYGISDLKELSNQSITLLSNCRSRNLKASGIAGTEAEYLEQERKTSETIEDKQKELNGDEDASGKVEEKNIEFLNLTYKYKNKLSEFEMAGLIEKMETLGRETEKIQSEDNYYQPQRQIAA